MSKNNEIIIALEEKKAKYQELLNKIDENLKEIRGEQELPLETFEDVEIRVKSKKIPPKFETGVRAIDKNMGGLTLGSNIAIAGKSKAGKSELTLKIIKNLSSTYKMCFFNFEMSENNLIIDKLPNLSQIQKRNLIIINSTLGDKKSGKVIKGMNTLGKIIQVVRQLSKKGVKFFLLDSRMKIIADKETLAEYNYHPNGNHESIAFTNEILTQITYELGIIFIRINQVALVDQRSGTFGLKGHGDLEYSYDVIFFLYKDTSKLSKNPTNEEINTVPRILYCYKNRFSNKFEEWKEDITNYSQKAPVVYEYEPKLDMPEI